MLDYFNSIDPLPLTGHAIEALAIIKDRINNDNEMVAERILPAELFTNPSKSGVRKAMTKLLSDRISEADRQQRVGEAALKKWLVSSNTKRSFMYFSKQALLRIAAVEFRIQLPSTLSIDRMIARLSEIVLQHDQDNTSTEVSNEEGRENAVQNAPTRNNDEVSIIQAVTKAILMRSFMKPLKGAQREHCKMGHKLELPIGNDFMKDLNENEMFPGFKIISLHAAGLVGKKDHPWAKDSIDFIAAVEDSSTFDIELWGIEIKSRQTSNTINLEKEHLNQLGRRKYEKVEAKEAARHIRMRSERFQVLHHAYVYGFKRVALVIGNRGGKVISGTIIQFQYNLIEAYGKVIEKLKDETLSWAYFNFGDDDSIKSLQIPREIIEIADEIPTINGAEALYETFKLWRRMFHNPSRLPMPILKMLIPTAHAKWNSCKGGSDTITKLIDDCIVIPPKQHTNNQSAVIGRCISNLTATILRLYQITSSKKDLSSAHPSICHYRNAASQRCTFQSICRKLYRVCKSKIEVIESLNGQEDLRQEMQQQRARRKRYRNSTVPDLMTFAPKQTFKTPRKSMQRQIENKTIPTPIIERSLECTGFPFELVNPDEGNPKFQGKNMDPRRTCVRCGGKTKWYCIKCKKFLCISYKGTKFKSEELYYTVEKESKDEKSRNITKIWGKSCFHMCHPAMQNAIQGIKTCQPCNNQH